MAKHYQYHVTIKWTGNKGKGTSSYREYSREHIISIDNKPGIPGSSDPAFRGDKTKYSPEDLLVSSLSACHMLWYLHLCAETGVIVNEYSDNATGIMSQTGNGSGYFTEVILSPVVVVTYQSMTVKAYELHKKANELCFIARSVNFPVHHKATVIVR